MSKYDILIYSSLSIRVAAFGQLTKDHTSEDNGLFGAAGNRILFAPDGEIFLRRNEEDPEVMAKELDWELSQNSCTRDNYRQFESVGQLPTDSFEVMQGEVPAGWDCDLEPKKALKLLGLDDVDELDTLIRDLCDVKAILNNGTLLKFLTTVEKMTSEVFD